MLQPSAKVNLKVCSPFVLEQLTAIYATKFGLYLNNDFWGKCLLEVIEQFLTMTCIMRDTMRGNVLMSDTQETNT
jgi:hypothetical protein